MVESSKALSASDNYNTATQESDLKAIQRRIDTIEAELKSMKTSSDAARTKRKPLMSDLNINHLEKTSLLLKHFRLPAGITSLDIYRERINY